MANKKQREPKPYKQPALFLAYFYKPDGDKDACTFVGDNHERASTAENQFLRYANKYNDWGIKREDIEGVYLLDKEDDAHGRDYKIIIN